MPPSSHSELCFNLWAIVDEETQLVYSYSGKVYALTGSDEEKLRILQTLAAHDHLTVPTRSIPDRFVLVTDDGNINATSMATVSNPDSSFWEELFAQLVDELPPIIRFVGSNAIETKLLLPEDPLACITTLVESRIGIRTAKLPPT